MGVGATWREDIIRERDAPARGGRTRRHGAQPLSSEVLEPLSIFDRVHRPRRILRRGTQPPHRAGSAARTSRRQLVGQAESRRGGGVEEPAVDANVRLAAGRTTCLTTPWLSTSQDLVRVRNCGRAREELHQPAERLNDGDHLVEGSIRQTIAGLRCEENSSSSSRYDSTRLEPPADRRLRPGVHERDPPTATSHAAAGRGPRAPCPSSTEPLTARRCSSRSTRGLDAALYPRQSMNSLMAPAEQSTA